MEGDGGARVLEGTGVRWSEDGGVGQEREEEMVER